jgi:peptidylprolyl isomerase
VTFINKIAGMLSALLALAGTAAYGQTAPAAAPAPIAAPAPENVWHLDLSTGGRVSILLRPDVAPGHVERIRTLTRQGFYNGLTFHRVIEGFMAQGGDPTGSGQGGSTLPDLEPEFNPLPHLRGAVAMARTQAPNSANSQFYIIFQPTLSLDNRYTVFGRVFAGMNFVDALERGEPPANPSRIVRASIGSDNVPPLPAEQLRAAAVPPPAPPQAAPPATSVITPPR